MGLSLKELQDNKVDKISGKQLSTNDFTAADKTKLDGIENNANNYVHPTNHTASVITQDSTHRFVTDTEKNTWNAKAGTAVATTSTNGLMSSTDKTKLDGVAAGAQTNQNAFSNVKVGTITVAADAPTDILELVAGANITLTPDATNDKVTISATNTTYNVATTSVNGLMSSTDKTKLDGVAAGANNYSLPIATSTILGGVKSGTDITVDASGNVSVNDDSHNHTIANVDGLQTALDGKAASTHTHAAASTSVAGLVQLSTATNSTSTTLAATASAVKAAMDKANSAFQSASDGKTEIATAITGKGVSATSGDTFSTLSTKIGQIHGPATGTAVAGDVLSGKTFSNGSGLGVTGTMPNNGAVVLTPGTTNQAIAAGYHSGSGYVAGDADLVSANIKSGKNIFGVIGTLVQGTPYATGTLNCDSSGGHASVSGLSFTPSIICLFPLSSYGYDNYRYITFYWDYISTTNFLYSRADLSGEYYTGNLGTDYYVNSGGFRLKSDSDLKYKTMKWYAFSL